MTIGQRDFRSNTIIVVATMLDVDEGTKDDLAAFHRVRWDAELDLRSVKTTMQMETLRCKTPELIRKEIWNTCSPTTSSARSWLKRRVSTRSSHGRSASKGPCKPWKPFNV